MSFVYVMLTEPNFTEGKKEVLRLHDLTELVNFDFFGRIIAQSLKIFGFACFGSFWAKKMDKVEEAACNGQV